MCTIGRFGAVAAVADDAGRLRTCYACHRRGVQSIVRLARLPMAALVVGAIRTDLWTGVAGVSVVTRIALVGGPMCMIVVGCLGTADRVG